MVAPDKRRKAEDMLGQGMSRTLKTTLGVCGFLALAGCDTLMGVTGGLPVETQTVVADGAVVVAGPRGFCVDPASTRPSGEVPFVMMGNCAVISRDGRAPQPNVKAVLTATVATLDPPFVFDSADPGLPIFFEGTEGRAALSRAGDPATVEVLESFVRGPAFYLHARDTSPGPVANLDATHWRAIFGVNGRVVSAAVLDFQGSALPPDRSLTVLSEFVERIRMQSVGRGAPVAVVQAPETVPVVRSEGTPMRTLIPTPRPTLVSGPAVQAPVQTLVPQPAAPPAVRPGLGQTLFPPMGFLRRIFRAGE